MKEELNFQSPYKVFFEENVYTFETKNNHKYRVSFNLSNDYFEYTSTFKELKKVYTLNVEKISSHKEPLDVKVQKTIDQILQFFFEDPENSIIYLCDFQDNRELKRRNHFNKWFENSSFKNQVIKIDDIIETEDLNYYTSIIYTKHNPLRKYLETAYIEMLYFLKNKN